MPKGARTSSGGGGIGGLTMKSSDITRGYVDSTNARVINQALRDNIALNDYNKEIVARMDKAMQTTKSAMTLYREFSLFNVEDVFNIHPKGNTFDDLKKAAIGAEFTDKGFMSTYHTFMGNQYGSAKMVISAKP